MVGAQVWRLAIRIPARVFAGQYPGEAIGVLVLQMPVLRQLTRQPVLERTGPPALGIQRVDRQSR